MNPTVLNPVFNGVNTRQQRASAPRASAPRRAYLDTYAKQRASQGARAGLATHLPTPTPINYSQQPAPSMATNVVSDFVQSRKKPQPAMARSVIRAAYYAQNQQQAESKAQKVDKDPELEANLRALYNPSLTHEMANSDSTAAQHIRTIVASALVCGVLTLGIFAFMTRADAQPVVAQPIGAPVIEVEVPVNHNSNGKALAASDRVARDPSHPVRIVISSLGINASVDGLGTTPEGKIAVPKSYGVVGWYDKSKVPAEAGPAVLVGHYTGGYNGVFDKLDQLKDGDLITITNGKKQNFTYKVSKKAEYDKNKVPMQKIFAKGDGPRLEIITCQGSWQGNTYNKRLVVTAELVK